MSDSERTPKLSVIPLDESPTVPMPRPPFSEGVRTEAIKVELTERIVLLGQSSQLSPTDRLEAVLAAGCCDAVAFLGIETREAWLAECFRVWDQHAWAAILKKGEARR